MMTIGDKMVTGKLKKYFIPDVNCTELIKKEDYVIAVEFDTTDMTEKVRFLNGDAVQAFAVCDTDEQLSAAYEEFLIYKAKYWECRKLVDPIEQDLHKKYIELYHDFASPEFGQIIKDRHNPEVVLAKQEEKQCN